MPMTDRANHITGGDTMPEHEDVRLASAIPALEASAPTFRSGDRARSAYGSDYLVYDPNEYTISTERADAIGFTLVARAQYIPPGAALVPMTLEDAEALGK